MKSIKKLIFVPLLAIPLVLGACRRGPKLTPQTFTVSLKASDTNLALLEKEESEELGSLIGVDVGAPFREFTYQYFDIYYGGYEMLDTEETTYEYGAIMEDGKVQTFDFFKYTFYLENYGNTDVKFDWFLNIAEDVKTDDGRSVLDILRVIVFVDGVDTIYGQALSEPHYDNPEGKADYRAPVSVDKDQASDTFPFIGYAEDFYSSDVIAAFYSQSIDKGQTIRYTIVAWLEGFRSDPEDFAPRGAQIKLGVDINSYENK